MDSNKVNLTMEPIIELIWSHEEEESENIPRMGETCLAGSCACVATGMFCSVPGPTSVNC